MIRLRSITDGSVVDVPKSCSVEILDQQGNVALLLLPDPVSNALKLIHATEEPTLAESYGRTYGVRFSRTFIPDLSSLNPPEPQALQA